MTTHADVARLVVNAIDGAEFLEHQVVDVSVRDEEYATDVYLILADGTRWALVVVNLTPSAAGNDRPPVERPVTPQPDRSPR